jgi:hypothetical protein
LLAGDTIRLMSNMSTPQPTSGVAPPWPPNTSFKPRPQWPIFTFLSLTLLVTIGVAVAGWFRPMPDSKASTPTYTGQQVSDAKTRVCAAYSDVHSAIGVTMARDGGTDPTAQLAVATSARQSLLAGSEYLKSTLSEEPATAPDLAAAIRKLSTLFQQYTVSYLNGRTNSEIESSLRAGDETTATIVNLCK